MGERGFAARSRGRRPFWSLTLIASALILALLLYQTRPESPKPKAKPRVWRVEAALVQPGNFSPKLKLYGHLETDALVKKRAPIASQVVEVRVAEGDRFEKGELLLRLEPRDFVPPLREIEAELEALQAERRRLQVQLQHERELLEQERKRLQLQKRELERAEQLLKRKLGSQALYDQAKERYLQQKIAVSRRALAIATLPLQIGRIEARIEQAQARYTRAKVLLERSVIIAPFDGVVDQLAVAPGEIVQPGQLLLSFYDPNRLEVRARIPAPNFAELARAWRRGERLEAEGESFGVSFRARLDRFSGRMGQAGVDALFQIVDRHFPLRLEMPVVLWLQRPTRKRLIPLPESALYGKDLVYRIEEGRLQPVVVQTVGMAGRRGGRSWILVESRELRAGDLVLSIYLPEASAGSRVEIGKVVRWAPPSESQPAIRR